MDENGIKPPEKLRTAIAENSFVNRSIQSWNNLPGELRTAGSLAAFKKEAKCWVMKNIPI